MLSFRTLAGAAALGTALTLTLGGQATAEPVQYAGKARVTFANTQVTAWHDYGVHKQPNNGTKRLSYVTPGGTYSASCWTPGQQVRVGNVTNHVWIKLDRTWPKPNGYVPAAALQGDAHANVPNQC